jgi:hypothetical protein
MAKAAQAALTVQVAVFGFDPDPATPSSRALNILTVGGKLPSAAVEQRETTADAGTRAVADAGVDLGAGRRKGGALNLVGLGDEPGRGARSLAAWYSATASFMPPKGRGRWASAGRGLRLDAEGAAVAKAALDRLRSETRHVAGAAALLGDVFTGDDLLRLHTALHGGPQSSERTFRRRVQELRDSGVLRPVKDSEVASLRQRVARFRSPAGTGGRPPELLRYSGNGGDDEQLAGLRARRSA